MDTPKILIISNQCLSSSNSNGRTLGNMLGIWPKERIAQFCLNLTDPDTSLCNNYFCVSDTDALNAFCGKPITAQAEGTVQKKKQTPSTKNRTAIRMLIRNIIWNSNRWKKCGYDDWVDAFNPDIVLLQSGDAAFMCDLARKTAQRKQIPLMIFNTEGYYFFKSSWFDNHWTDFLCFPLFKRLYRYSFRHLMKYASYSVFLNSKLQEDYDAAFGTKSIVLYTGSSCQFKPKDFNISHPRFSYLGNLGLNRPLALIEVAMALQAINSSYHLDVYGALPRGDENVFDGCPAIKYHGLISYEEVQKVMYESDVLFHVESAEGKWINSLQYAFSTKIADSLTCGTNFLLYAPSHLACSKYIIENAAAWYVEKKESLVPILKTLMTSALKRKMYIENAKRLATENHNSEKNTMVFQKIIYSLCK